MRRVPHRAATGCRRTTCPERGAAWEPPGLEFLLLGLAHLSMEGCLERSVRRVDQTELVPCASAITRQWYPYLWKSSQGSRPPPRPWMRTVVDSTSSTADLDTEHLAPEGGEANRIGTVDLDPPQSPDSLHAAMMQGAISVEMRVGSWAAPGGNTDAPDLGSAREPTMSKMDGLRAMREARYEQRRAATTRPTAGPNAIGQPVAKPTEAQEPAAEPEPPRVPLCGHRAIGGRACTRDQGHSAKSHRYS